MSYELFIALRYLTAKRKQTFVSVISLISVLGVIVGVAALIIALALMTGFQQDIREKILGANAHLTVFGSWAGRPIEDPDRVVRNLLSVPGIVSAAPVVLEKGLIVSDLNPGGTAVVLKGVRLEQERHVTDLARAHVLALKALLAGGAGDIINLGTETGYSVLEVVRTAEKVTGRAVPYDIGPRRPGDVAVLLASKAKAEARLGWKPRLSSLETIVETAWNWHRKSG